MYNYTRRQFLRLCCRVLLLLGLDSMVPPGMRPRAEASEALSSGLHTPLDYFRFLPAQNLRRIITADPTNSATIMWQSEELRQEVRVEYRKAGDKKVAWASASHEMYGLSEKQIRICTAHLEKLEANTRYDYRLVSGDAASSWQSMKTAGYGSIEAIIVCDSQCGNDYGDWKATIHAAADRHPGADFIADLGDIVDIGQSDWHWREWYDGIDDLLPRYIFVPVMGNHECYDTQWKNSLPTGYLQQFSLPVNGSRKFLGYYYSFNYGPAHFLVLNTQFQELDDLRPGLLKEELSWMREDMAKSTRPWNIVLMHKDILSYNEYNPYTKGIGGLNDIAHDFMEIFDAMGIDLVLTGHMHTYRNRGHIYGFKPSDHGPVYVLCGLSGNAHYDVPLDPDFDRVSAPQPETDNYVTLDISPHALRLRCYLPDGTLLDDMSLAKPAAPPKG